MIVKHITMRAVATGLSTGLLYGTLTSSAAAITPYEIKKTDGTPFVTLRVFNVGDGVYGSGDESEWNLTGLQMDQIIAATQYWSEVIDIVPGNNPAIINVGTSNKKIAAADSHNATMLPGSPSTVQAALTNQFYTNLTNDAHGYIVVGTLDWASQPYRPSHIGLTDKPSLSTVFIHEIAYALGVGANAYQGNPGELYFDSAFNNWSTHLRDDNGNAAAPDQSIWCSTCTLPTGYLESDAFDVRKDQAYFTGTHVSEVLKGAMKGLPMRIATDYGPIDSPLFSHIELKNSLMSHQYYRNYNTLMEAELAALQDIGYTIDRRNFYGNSVYGDGVTLINNNPFYARNKSGSAYISNTYNMSTMGLGLHVYGSNNTIFQRADLLSAGAGGGGIRIDGAANKLTVLPGARVYADGADGRAIMFAYGKDHELVHRGDAQALGDNGIAISFDFGHNSRGDASGTRGSYIHESNFLPVPGPLLPELDGALVNRFDLTGRVAGRQAAIFMSENAWVDQINVMQGAAVTGDIISKYRQNDENGKLRLTHLNFGLKADSEGRSTGIADKDFSLAYTGNITGENLALKMAGGTTHFSGNHNVFNVVVEQGATLAGQGIYQVDASQQFLNQGTVNPSIPGAAITINGDYTQANSGTLQFAFNDQYDITALFVNGSATIDGTVSFAPVKGWYRDGFGITSNQWLQPSAISGAFSTVSTSLASPTLSATAADNGNRSYTVTLARAGDAYSRYAQNPNGLGVGLALDAFANTAPSGLKGMLASLDFSVADGSDVRSALPQLSAEAYASATGVLSHASGATRSAVSRRLQHAFDAVPLAIPSSAMYFSPVAQARANAAMISPGSNIAWGSSYGSWANQSGNHGAARTKSTLGGFTMGIDTLAHEQWRVGVLAGYSHSTFKTEERGSSGQSDNYTLGAYSGAEWPTSNGALGLRSGLAYSWHGLSMNRSVAFADFSDQLSADYHARTFQAFGEVGYKFNVGERSVIEPYANLAYVRVRQDGFEEKGLNGAALSVRSSAMDTTFSTLGIRASSRFELGSFDATARTDLGWRHAYGSINPTAEASFVGTSNAFTAVGSSIGRDSVLIETGLDVRLNQSALLQLAYQGQFGSGLSQNSVNANLNVSF